MANFDLLNAKNMGGERYNPTKSAYKSVIIPVQFGLFRYFVEIRRANTRIGRGGGFFLFFGIAGGIIQVRETHDRTRVQGGADGKQRIRQAAGLENRTTNALDTRRRLGSGFTNGLLILDYPIHYPEHGSRNPASQHHRRRSLTQRVRFFYARGEFTTKTRRARRRTKIFHHGLARRRGKKPNPVSSPLPSAKILTVCLTSTLLYAKILAHEGEGALSKGTLCRYPKI